MVQWIFSTNAKNIGTLYLIFALFSIIVGLFLTFSYFLTNLNLYNSFSKSLDYVYLITVLFDKLKFLPGVLLLLGVYLNIELDTFHLAVSFIIENTSNVDSEFITFSLIPLMGGSTKSKSLDPSYISEFADAESCFTIQIIKDKSRQLDWAVLAGFLINLHSKDLPLLKEIQSFFGGVGNIYFSTNKESINYFIQDINSLTNIIIPHFDQFPLQSAKSIDYLLWKECILLMANKEHLTQAGLEKIVSIKSAINLGLPDKLKIAFPHVKPLTRPSYIPSEDTLDPQWISGFVEGDACFTVSIRSSGQIAATFSIILNQRELPLLFKIQSFFEAGKINKDCSYNTVRYQVRAINQLNSIIINHFDSYPLVGSKLPNCLIFREIVSLMGTKSHLTQEGLIKIKSLKDKLNK